jgi:uncharacterized protein YyaL (SSP411 family)
VLWEKDPAKTLDEIEAIYEYKVHDRDTFMNNRHSDYFAGRTISDTLTFSKHSGLFAHAFAFVHSKTGENKYLEWARKSADLFWKARHPATGLIKNDFQRKETTAETSGMAQLALFLMRAYQWHADASLLEKALAYVQAYWKSFYAGEAGFGTSWISMERTPNREPLPRTGSRRSAWQRQRLWPTRLQRIKLLSNSPTPLFRGSLPRWSSTRSSSAL